MYLYVVCSSIKPNPCEIQSGKKHQPFLLQDTTAGTLVPPEPDRLEPGLVMCREPLLQDGVPKPYNVGPLSCKLVYNPVKLCLELP